MPAKRATQRKKGTSKKGRKQGSYKGGYRYSKTKSMSKKRSPIMKGGSTHIHLPSDKMIPLNEYAGGDPSYPPTMQSSRLLGGGGAKKRKVKGGASLLGSSDVVSSFGSVDSMTTNAKLMSGSSIVNPAVYSQNISRPALV